MGRHEAGGRTEKWDVARRYLWPTAIAFFGIGDVVTTVVGLSMGPIVEAGPAAAFVLRRYGFLTLVAVKLFVIAGAYLSWSTIPRPYNVGVPLGLVVVGTFVTVWNLGMIALAMPP